MYVGLMNSVSNELQPDGGNQTVPLKAYYLFSVNRKSNFLLKITNQAKFISALLITLFSITILFHV